MSHINRNHLSILILIIVSVFIRCRKKEEVPVVSTTEITNISATTATSGGEITFEGSSSIISRGVCWSKEPDPTIANNKTVDGTGSGSFSSNLTTLDGATHYFVRAYASNSAGTGYGTQLTFATIGQPPLPTGMAATNISATSATLNASVNANFLPTTVVFEYGTTTNYGDSLKATENPITGGTTSVVNADIKGLKATTLYHYRVKAANPLGITYGDDLTFTTVLSDVDGNTYNTVTIGTQVWMQENLKTTRYRNGDLIGTTSIATMDITGLTEPKYQWAHNIIGYGRLYTYYAITDSRNVCPTGWHVPTDGEWTTLTDYLSNNDYGYGGNRNYIAKALAATSGYTADAVPGNVGNDQAANNSSGFTGFPGGGRYSSGVMNFVSLHGIWWSSTESSPAFAFFRCIGYIPAAVFRGEFSESYGLSVRCLKDN
jgi:uncharacterized protein (TIGR02145 family)